MIDKQDIVRIGKFQKTHALKGELNAILDISPEYVEEKNPLVVEMEGIPVPFFAESIRPKGSISYLIKLEGVNSLDEAKSFVNKEIYAIKETLLQYGEENEDAFFSDDLIGYEVVDDVFGSIGKVDNVDDTTDNVLLVIEKADGEVVYVPFVDSFIKEIDDDEEIIYTSLPEDLINLNIK